MPRKRTLARRARTPAPVVVGRRGAKYDAAANGIEGWEITHVPIEEPAGEPLDSQRLFSLLYEELRKYARSRMAAERTNHTLQATAVVNEVWLRLGTEGRDKEWNSRGHFFASMAQSIRRILVDHARRKAAGIHGGGVVHHPVEDFDVVDQSDADDLLELDRALDELEKVDPRAARVVMLRYFGGMTVPQIAEQLGCSPSTVDRQWSAARTWLLVELRGDGRAWLTSCDDA